MLVLPAPRSKGMVGHAIPEVLIFDRGGPVYRGGRIIISMGCGLGEAGDLGMFGGAHPRGRADADTGAQRLPCPSVAAPPCSPLADNDPLERD